MQSGKGLNEIEWYYVNICVIFENRENFKDLLLGYTWYSQKDEHLEQPLTKIDHRSTHRCFDVVKTLERETVHDPSKIANWSNLLCKRKKVTNELLIIDQLANDPSCSLNRDNGPIGC